jgi:predicted NBD/HSP70 family sugar kinase
LFELAAAGQLAILPDSGDGLVTSSEALVRAQELEQELGSPVIVVEDADALAAALAAECGSARAYAERAVRGG